MDQFLLENVALYQNLVKRFKPAMPTPPRPASEPAEIPNPDMVVSARIRPLLDEDIASGFPCALFPRSGQSGVVDVHDLYHHPRGRPVLKSFDYQVDRLFGSEATSQEIYDSQVEDLVSFAWNGGIGTLFAYGQTGSGKTTTISGLEKLVVKSLIDNSGQQQHHPNDGRKKVHISIIELAGNSAYDLLNARSPISILEDAQGVTHLAGAQEHLLVQGRPDVATDLIERAASFRRTASTQKNDASSRSHSICRLRIQTDDDDGGGGGGGGSNKSGRSDADGFLYLVDLAGSEAARDVATHGAERMRETREINISLSVLKDCIRGKARADALLLTSATTAAAATAAASGSKLQQQQQMKKKKMKERPPHIPFRQSALTKVLKHVFDPPSSSTSTSAGKTKTVVVACVNPSLADVGPSKNTLRYAEMLRVSVPAAVAAAATTGSSSSSDRKVGSNLAVEAPSAPQLATSRPSSRDPDPAAASVPFHKRIRPGMAISYIPSPPHHHHGLDIAAVPANAELAVVLCPSEAVGSSGGDGGGGGSTNDAHGNALKPRGGSTARYLCAQVTPGGVSETYEVNLWQHIIVDVSRMEREVILEYDAGTRYYRIASG